MKLAEQYNIFLDPGNYECYF